MPEKVFSKIKSNILPQWTACFVAAMVTGLIAHLYKLTGWLPNWDSLVFRYDPQRMIGLGRWFLNVVCAPGSFYDLPFLNGLISIVSHALGSVVMCRILNVKSKVTAALIGGVVASFPAVTSVLMYSYVADGYGIAFLLSCLAAYYMTRNNPRYFVAALLVTFSAGIYQAYITVTVMLVIMYLVEELGHREKPTKEIFVKTLKIFFSGFAGIVLYFVILKILLAFFSKSLLNYQGLNDAASLSSVDIKASLYCIKETFLSYFFHSTKGISVFSVLNGIIFIFTLCFYIAYGVKKCLFASFVKVIILCGLGFCMILGSSCLAFLNASIDYHNLMLMGYCVFYVFFIIIYERGSGFGDKFQCTKKWVVLVLSGILIFNQVVIANVSYHKAQIAYEKSYGVVVRIADRIEQLPDYSDADKILVIGSLEGSEAYSVELPPDITGITDGYIVRADDETVGQSVLCSTLNDYCGMNYSFLAGKEKTDMMQKKEIKDMAVWPSAGCVRIVDDIVVIKLSTEGE